MRWLPELLWRRACAYLLDIAILFAILGPVGFLVQQWVGLRPRTGTQIWYTLLWNFSLPVWLYFTASDAGSRGATLGKRLLCVRVRTVEGGQVFRPRAFLRTAIKLLPWELVHVSAFALGREPDDFRPEQWVGILAANFLVVGYLVVASATGGRRSVHDFVAGTCVERV